MSTSLCPCGVINISLPLKASSSSYSWESFCCFQNVLRGCSALLGPGTSGLWRALTQSQSHIPAGGPAELTELLELYAQNLARNMKLTYLNPVALVAPNIGEFKITRAVATVVPHKWESDGNRILISTADFLQLSHNTVNHCCEIRENNSL